MAIIPSAHGSLHQHIYGAVSPDGKKMWGEGFESHKIQEGAYEIYFQQPFRGIPTAVCTIFGSPEHTFDKSVAVVKVDEWTFVCFTSAPGNVVDSAFTFIVFGDA